MLPNCTLNIEQSSDGRIVLSYRRVFTTAFTTAIRQGYVWLVVIGVLNTAISAYYYLRLIVVMFFRERNAPWDAPRIPTSVAIALVITIVGVFYLGLFPERVIKAFGARPSISIIR